ncbi:MAG: protein-tyrosine-phosphatase [Saprospiraceae bacterium]
MISPNLFDQLENYCQNFENEFNLIPDDRKSQLEELAQYISQKQTSDQPTRLNVICTHNSRRSHIGQLWLGAAALFYKKNNIHTFSGGTEATAFNHRSVAALRRAGFEIVTSDSAVDNPIYFATFGFSHSPLKMFSKKYDHAENPQKEFAAIMVCSDADVGCPVILGAENRFALTFDDPKHFDNTDLESEKYDERVRQIGREMFYVMKNVE